VAGKLLALGAVRDPLTKDQSGNTEGKKGEVCWLGNGTATR